MSGLLEITDMANPSLEGASTVTSVITFLLPCIRLVVTL